MRKPVFLISIDTEGDDAWARPQVATTRNAGYLRRFQDLCERFGLRPTYLTTYEMARCPVFQTFGRDVLAREAAEIGMHLHAWDTPPLVPLTSRDWWHQPYLIEFPDPVMREKIRTMTALLQETFDTPIVSHRAGRWALDERYARLLIEEGYRVDCTVTPLVSWRATRGDPAGSGGPDYRNFPSRAYWLDLDRIARPGSSTLLEVPVTIVPGHRTPLRRAAEVLVAGGPTPIARPLTRIVDRLSPPRRWLRADGRNRADLLAIVGEVARQQLDHAHFTLHSSELMPGGSPRFRTAASIERLFTDLEVLFRAVSRHFVGATLSEFHALASGIGTGAHAAAW